MAAPQRYTGRVKWFDPNKGWGFILADDGSEDIFVHQQCLDMDGFRSLNDDEEVNLKPPSS